MQPVPIGSPPTLTLTVYVPSPSNCSSGPAATIVPAGSALPTQNGSLSGCVGSPSGTLTIVSATVWKLFGAPEVWTL
jgi:hypothetical protein